MIVQASHEDTAGRERVEAGVDPDRPCEAWLRHDRRNDVLFKTPDSPPLNVIPAKAGTHASLNACYVRDFHSGFHEWKGAVLRDARETP